MKISIAWFRRDLRIEDNTAFFNALQSNIPVLPIFIFDEDILEGLEKNDARVNFIYDQLSKLNEVFEDHGCSMKILKGSILEVWKQLVSEYDIDSVYCNEDYEPYATLRDQSVSSLLKTNGIKFKAFIDHVIFKPGTILKNDDSPYSVFTPFKNKWLIHLNTHPVHLLPNLKLNNLISLTNKFPSLSNLGFSKSRIKVKEFTLLSVNEYDINRDFPSLDGTSYLGPHLRFGTVSVRSIVKQLNPKDSIFLSELIWREFFIQIMFFYPRVINENFKVKYNGIEWRNNEKEFELWCNGQTGYPIVDAGMRQLNETGYMHNRVRMITASFLCKHLLIDWRWGEAYFAEKLLDYELASNNGNWQWVAGTGCDSAPYFRVFSPSAQTLKFDSKLEYITKWVPELNELGYTPMVDHKMARERALLTYKTGLNS